MDHTLLSNVVAAVIFAVIGIVDPRRVVRRDRSADALHIVEGDRRRAEHGPGHPRRRPRARHLDHRGRGHSLTAGDRGAPRLRPADRRVRADLRARRRRARELPARRQRHAVLDGHRHLPVRDGRRLVAVAVRRARPGRPVRAHRDHGGPGRRILIGDPVPGLRLHQRLPAAALRAGLRRRRPGRTRDSAADAHPARSLRVQGRRLQRPDLRLSGRAGRVAALPDRAGAAARPGPFADAVWRRSTSASRCGRRSLLRKALAAPPAPAGCRGRCARAARRRDALGERPSWSWGKATSTPTRSSWRARRPTSASS